MSTKIFYVEEGEVQEWTIREDGRLLDQDEQETKWRVASWDAEGHPTVLRLYEGDHFEYGDRDENVQLETEPEFFTLDRVIGDAQLVRLNVRAEHERAQTELLREHGLDQETIAFRQQELLREHGLDQETIALRRQELLREHGLLD